MQSRSIWNRIFPQRLPNIMKLKLSLLPPLGAALALLAAYPSARGTVLTIDAGHPGAAINPSMWGIFFEDINFGADGGLYAEMVKNRSFEFPDAMMGWTEISPRPEAKSSCATTIL